MSKATGKVSQGSAFVTAALALAFFAGLLFLAPVANAQANPQAKAAGKPAAKAPNAAGGQVARGKYLVAILGCNDCHTPLKMGANGPEPDMTRMLSGHPQDMTMPPAKAPDMPWMWTGAASMTAFAGPWGTTYAVNLTPDEETGIGAWDEALFLQIFHSKKWMGSGRAILPPMPIDDYSLMTDQDLKAVFAYLRTIPPIKNKVPEYTPPASGPGAPGGGGGK